MRTIPKALSQFREIVNEKGQRLRKLSFQELQRLNDAPTEHLTVDSRPATVDIIVQALGTNRIRVVVQGFMMAKLLGQNVALDGFYKCSDETVSPMPESEFYEFD
jgi:phage protein U